MVASSRAAVRMFNAIASRRKIKDIYELLQLMEDGDETALNALTAQARAFGRGLQAHYRNSFSRTHPGGWGISPRSGNDAGLSSFRS